MLEIVNKDIFTVDNSYILCHCISADWPRGYKGIAGEFERRFAFDEALTTGFPNYKFIGGDCLVVICNKPDYTIANLITKERYFHKPTNLTIMQALNDLKQWCFIHKQNKIAMPYLIGCGMDRLKESDVLEIIHNIFDNTDIEVLICKK